MEQHNNNDVLPPIAPVSSEQMRPNDYVVEANDLETKAEMSTGIAIEAASTQQDPMASAGGANASLPLMPLNGQSNNSAVTHAVSSVLSADDIDLIEKEWVEKAKEVIRLTSEDPAVQTKEVSKLKSDYLKKRFNMDVRALE